MPVPGMWGKIKPEWVQANEMLRMRIGRGWRCHSCEELLHSTRWMWGLLPFTPKALP
jgi:hypothetical protein